MRGFLRTAVLAALAVGAYGCPDEAKKDDHLVKAEDLLSQKKFKEAVPEYDASLAANPNQGVDVLKEAAYAHVQISDFDKAAQILLKTVDLATTPAGKVEALTNVAGIYLQSAHKPEKAMPYFEQALQIDPKSEQTLNWLGETASELGGAREQAAPAVTDQLDKALAYYDQILSLNPKRVDTWAAKRIALVKYISALDGGGTAIGPALDPAARKAKVEKLKAMLTETNQKMGELNKMPAPAKAP
jgi:tetratricopeptide (TPR) repeat protein